MAQIALLRLKKLGDIVLTTSLLQHLQKNLPYDDFLFITKEEYKDLEKIFPRKIKFEYLKAPYKTNSIINLSSILSRRKIDIILDLQENPTSILISILSRPKKKYAYNKEGLKRHLHIGSLNKLNTSHTIKKYFHAAERAWLIPRDSILIPPLLVPDFPTERALPAGSNLVILAGSGRYTKRWLPEYYVKLTNMLMQINKSVVFVGGSADKELLLYIKSLGTSGIFMHPLPLYKIAQCINEADIVLGGDSGLTHIAWALKKQIVFLAGGTHMCLGFFPFGNKVTILEEDLPCRPCSLHGLSHCPQKHFQCMKSLTPERVFTTLLALWPPV